MEGDLDLREVKNRLIKELQELHKQTNADRIRSMSDEELANFLMEVGMGSLFEKKIMNVKDWLQLEVEG